jgi:hypothetical protein
VHVWLRTGRKEGCQPRPELSGGSSEQLVIRRSADNIGHGEVPHGRKLDVGIMHARIGKRGSTNGRSVHHIRMLDISEHDFNMVISDG